MSFPFFMLAQQNNNQDVSNELKVEITNGSISLRLQGKEIKHETLVSDLNSLFKLNQDHSFKDVSERTDDLGYTHYNYKQYYKGIEIDGGLLMVHSKNGLVTSINGKVAEFDNLDLQTAISEVEAQQFAKTSLKVTSLSKEYAIKKLIYWNKGKGEQEPCLVYKVRIESSSPFLNYNVFVDAKTGKIINKISLIANGDVSGTAKTYYHGVNYITMDSIQPNEYILKDNSRNFQVFDASEGFQDLEEIKSIVKGFDGRFTGTYTFVMHDTYGDGWNGATVDIIVGSPSSANSISNVGFSFGYSSTQSFVVPADAGRDSIFIGNWTPTNDMSESEISWEIKDPYGITIEGGVFGDDFDMYCHDDYGDHVENFATDVHFGIQQSFDYFENIHSRNGFDDQGGVVGAIINKPSRQLELGGNPNNASAGFIQDSIGILDFGIGDGVEFDYWGSLDLVGHEFTHLVVGKNGSGGLVYQGESGALNESFADIFGTCIEHYTYNNIPTNTIGKTPNWIMFEDICLISTSVRSMEQPKLRSNPDTYDGDYWVNPTDTAYDNGGVHINSGVQNKWFYLLSEGGAYINDNNYSYDVEGIGMADAARIAYRNLIYHLTPNANYVDAYEGSLNATEEIFGIGTEYLAVIKAWNAVGVFGSLPEGCMDGNACNYDPAAMIDDGSCDYSCYGCIDPLACNYDPAATQADGSCDYSCYGCMDPTAENYDPTATIDDGSCVYTVVYGCIDPLACNYDVNATIDDANCYYSILATIDQDGDYLYAATTPVGLNADWYNTQTEDSTTRVWLMEEDAPLFTPTFECTYYIKVEVGNCSVTSEPYYFGATAKRIGSLVTSPNPTTGNVNVQFQNLRNQFVYLHLMNGNGVKLDDFITKNTELDIDISKYPSGTYYLYFDSSDSKQGCNPEEVEMISTKIILNK